MRILIYILIFLIPIHSFCQLSSDEAHRFINELIRDHYNSKVILIDTIPCNDHLKINGSYLEASVKMINMSLTKNEISFLLNFCDSTKCFLQPDSLEYYIKLCDSTSIHIKELDSRFKFGKGEPKSSCNWQKDKIASKNKNRMHINKLAFSLPVVNDAETLIIIHIVKDIGKYGLSGETILFKKINSRWTRICNLYHWIT